MTRRSASQQRTLRTRHATDRLIHELSAWGDDDDYDYDEGTPPVAGPPTNRVETTDLSTARARFWAEPKILKDGDRVTEAMIYGLTNIKEKTAQLIRLIQNWEEFCRIPGVKLPRGMLLYGRPGNGKTMTLRWLMSEVPGDCFLVRDYPVTTADWQAQDISEMYGEARQRIAENGRPVLLLWDEMDAYVRKNTNVIGKDKVASAICAEMDGVEGQNDPIFLVGTANYTGGFEEAMVRAGRMSLVAECGPLPPAEARRYTQMKSAEMDLIQMTDDYLDDLMGDGDRTAIEIAEALSRIKTHAILDGLTFTAKEIARAALKEFRPIPGEKPEPDVLRDIAWHEVGHALVAHATGLRINCMDVFRVTGHEGSVQIASNSLKSQFDGFRYMATAMAGRLMEIRLKGLAGASLFSALEDYGAIAQQFITAFLKSGGKYGASMDWKALTNQIDFAADDRIIQIDALAELVALEAYEAVENIFATIDDLQDLAVTLAPLVDRLTDEGIILGSDAMEELTLRTGLERGWYADQLKATWLDIPDLVGPALPVVEAVH